MRKHLARLLILCLCISTAVFALLWRSECSSKDDLKALAQAEAAHAYIEFAMYQDDGDLSSYWDGVAAFRAFQQAYRSAFQGTDRAADHLICDEVYGHLLAGPEKTQAYMADIAAVMEALSGDVEDLAGHARMLELRNALTYE